MEIQLASAAQLDEIMNIYESARTFMAENGNPGQWVDGYPERWRLEEDIAEQRLYLCVQDEEIYAVFCYMEQREPDYDIIYEGQWLNEESYAVVHRLAVAVRGKGAGRFCLDYAFSRCQNQKIDTGCENIPMQRLLKKCGYTYCGIVYLYNGGKRMAYQKIKTGL